MNLTLQEEDRRAVDLLLDGAAAVGSGNGNQIAYAVTDASLGERVARTHKLVQLLDALPQFEPPADLVDRTLRFIENSSDYQHAPAATLPEILGEQRPVV